MEGRWSRVSSFLTATCSRSAGMSSVLESGRGKGIKPQNNVKRYLETGNAGREGGRLKMVRELK